LAQEKLLPERKLEEGPKRGRGDGGKICPKKQVGIDRTPKRARKIICRSIAWKECREKKAKEVAARPKKKKHEKARNSRGGTPRIVFAPKEENF